MGIGVYVLHHDPLIWNDPEVSTVPPYVFVLLLSMSLEI